MNIIAEKPWSYVIFQDGEQFYITLILGGVIDIDVTIQLTSDDVATIEGYSASADMLADKIRRDIEKFRNRQIIPPIWPRR